MPEGSVKNRTGPMSEILKLLEDVGLVRTVVDVQPFVKKVVLEFYANMSKSMSDTTSDNAYLSYVRGHLFAFSPYVISRYLNHVPTTEAMVPFDMNEVVTELTKGKVTVWNGKRGLKASALTLKYSILHKLGRKNWVPTHNHSKVSKELG